MELVLLAFVRELVLALLVFVLVLVLVLVFTPEKKVSFAFLSVKKNDCMILWNSYCWYSYVNSYLHSR